MVLHPKRIPEKKLLVYETAFAAAALLALVAIVAGCNTGGKPITAAQANQNTTTVIADECTAAAQAKSLYDAGGIPQTDASRKTINAAIEACAEAKKLFTLALQAEQIYKQMQIQQVNACAAQPGGPAPANNTACQFATKDVASAQTAVDSALANLSAAVANLPAQATAVKAIPKQ